MTWIWDGPTLIGFCTLLLAVLGCAGRLCWMLKRMARHDAEMRLRIENIEKRRK